MTVKFLVSKNQPQAHIKWLREQMPLGIMVPRATAHTCRLLVFVFVIVFDVVLDNPVLVNRFPEGSMMDFYQIEGWGRVGVGHVGYDSHSSSTKVVERRRATVGLVRFYCVPSNFTVVSFPVFAGSPSRGGRTGRLGADATGAHGPGVDGGLRRFRANRRPELGGVPHRPAVPVPGVRVHVRRVHTGADHGPGRPARLRHVRLGVRHVLRRVPLLAEDVHVRAGPGPELCPHLGLRAVFAGHTHRPGRAHRR